MFNNRKLVAKTPIATAILLDGGVVQQIYQMWSERTAEGQSLWGWACINVALWLWLNFYRVMLPPEDRAFAFWATVISILLNFGVIGSIVYWRW